MLLCALFHFSIDPSPAANWSSLNLSRKIMCGAVRLTCISENLIQRSPGDNFHELLPCRFVRDIRTSRDVNYSSDSQ